MSFEMRRAAKAVAVSLLFAGTLTACGDHHAEEAGVAALFLPGDGSSVAAKDQLATAGLQLNDEQIAVLGTAVCKSLEASSPISETRAVVQRVALSTRPSASPASEPLDAADADHIIAAFRGPYCDQLDQLPR